MPAFTSIVGALALAVSSASAIASADQAEEAQFTADQAAGEQETAQIKADQKLEAKKKAEDDEAALNQKRALRGQMGNGTRRSSSIFTSPVGVVGNPMGQAGKTTIGT